MELEDIYIVKEYPKVFPNELPRLPPSREVNFNIVLVPGSQPISKAPYRMVLAKMKELKVQLEELVEKEFVRPSMAPVRTNFPDCLRVERWTSTLNWCHVANKYPKPRIE